MFAPWGTWLFPPPQRWEIWTRSLVSSSILAFLPLQLPQILRNAAMIASNDPLQIAQLQVIPLLGYTSGMLANLLLMSYLADRQELWGTIVQSLGVITSGIVVTQLFSVGLVDPRLFGILALGVSVGFLFNFGRLWLPRITPSSPELTPELGQTRFDRYWSWWQNGLNILGLTLFPLILTVQLHDSLIPQLPLEIGMGSASLLFGLSSTTLLGSANVLGSANWMELTNNNPLLLSFHSLIQLFRRHWSTLSGWTANLLFMFGPTAQLINNIAHPESIAALSLSTQFLSVLGNLLILARSGTLWIQGHDRVWAVGGVWEVILRGLVFSTIAYFGFMPFQWLGLYGLGVSLYFLWIYSNARQSRFTT